MDMYAAIAEPTRRRILERLAQEGELSASEISSAFQASPPAISQHLKVLKDANLISLEKRAQKRIYTINPQPLLQMEEWMKRMITLWEERYDALDALLASEKKKMKGGE